MMEKIKTNIYLSANEASIVVADKIAEQINSANSDNKPFVLGLATGSTPLGVYRELIKKSKGGELSFKNTYSFNLDEYFGIGPDHPESYRKFMERHFFSHIDIPKENTFVPDGLIPREKLSTYCKEYERQIAQLGGIDVQLLGIGRTGHIGFNEPGSSIDSITRLIQLDDLTREDASRDFLGKENVPLYALTMGIRSILNAKHIFMLAWGRSKASIVCKALEGEPNKQIPASLLQKHDNIEVYLDRSASSELTKVKQPWTFEELTWEDDIIKHAVSWLSLKSQKPVLKLLDKDYSEYGLSSLLASRGPAHKINIIGFNSIQHTISGWPGGKPKTNDETRPERSTPFPKKVLFLAPEPQDTCLSSGATIQRLVQQGHEVKIAVLTSGKNSVPHDETEKYFSFCQKIHDLSGSDNKFFGGTNYDKLDENVKSNIKGSLRRAETLSALKVLGVDSDNIFFLDLPFYENGSERNYIPAEEDKELLASTIAKFEPQQIFITGKDLEPSTVQSICYSMTEEIMNDFSNEGWCKDCWLWLYESEKQIFTIGEIDMAVPMSPLEYANKSKAVFQHHSQQDQTPPISSDEGVTWPLKSRSDTLHANRYDSLGLAEYEAIETFVRIR
jgi:glucosamine-6-phosphate deaminase